jgi:hypothetical protein
MYRWDNKEADRWLRELSQQPNWANAIATTKPQLGLSQMGIQGPDSTAMQQAIAAISGMSPEDRAYLRPMQVTNPQDIKSTPSFKGVGPAPQGAFPAKSSQAATNKAGGVLSQPLPQVPYSNPSPQPGVGADGQTTYAKGPDGRQRRRRGNSSTGNWLIQAGQNQLISEGIKEGGRLVGEQVHGAPTVTGVDSAGNTIMSDGSVINPKGEMVKKGSYAAKGAEYAGYAMAAYKLYNALQAENKRDMARGVASAGIMAGQAYTGGNPLLSAANFGINATNIIGNDNMTAEQQATRLQQQAALAAADLYTAGLASTAEGLARKWGPTGKLLGKLDKLDQKTNPATWALAAGLKQIGSSKGKDQMARDRIRKMMQERGMLDENWNMVNADGSKWDIGKDGSKFEEFSTVDPNKGHTGQAIGAINPLAHLITGGDEKLATSFAGYMTNAVMQGRGGIDPAAANANALAQYKKAGFDTPEKAIAGIDELLKQGKIDEAKAAAFKNGIQTVFGIAKPAASQGPARPAADNPKKGGGKKRRKGRRRVYETQTYETNTYAPQTTAPMGTPSQYGDAFAQELANVYLSNQGL